MKKGKKRGGGKKKTVKNIQIRAEVAEQRQERKDYEIKVEEDQEMKDTIESEKRKWRRKYRQP
jgi:hypothetical protein